MTRAGPHIERQKMRVGSAEEEPIAKHAEAAIVRPAARADIVRKISAMAPDLPPCARVDRPGVAAPSRDVQDVVDRERR